MTDFEYDILQRKRLARNAKYKRNGSKSKKCSLLSDALTQKQWKERNGPMVTYNLNKPMDWVTFKSCPVDIQHQYIHNLVETYNASLTSFGDMFGVNRATVSAYLKQSNCPETFTVGSKMSRDNRESWTKFLTGENASTQDEPMDYTELNNDQYPASDINEEPVETIEVVEPKSNMTRIAVEYNGDISIHGIMNDLTFILGKNAKGTLKIEYILGN